MSELNPDQFSCSVCKKPLFSSEGYTPHSHSEEEIAQAQDRETAKQDILLDVGMGQIHALRHFPSDWVQYDKNRGFHIKYTSPKGWLHIMIGRDPMISHFPTGSDQDIGNATMLYNHDLPGHLQPYKDGITKEEFLKHVENAEQYGSEGLGFNW